MAKPYYSELIENSGSFKRLTGDISEAAVSHAYIFVSPDKMTLDIMSRLFAAEIISNRLRGKEELTDEKKDLIYQDLYTDVIVVPDKKDTVAVSDIDAMIQSLHVRPSAGAKKVYIIDYGETMNPSSQNKLLKTLEEPPPSVHIIINCQNIYGMLPTILSRCRKIEPQPFSNTQLYETLSKTGVNNDIIEIAIGASRGYIGYCHNLINDAKSKNNLDSAYLVLLSLHSSKNILENAAKLLNLKERLGDIIDFCEIIFRDIMVLNSGQKDLLLLKSMSGRTEKLAGMYSTDACLAILPLFTNAKERIKRYGNTNSIIDQLLFGIAENKAKYN